MDTGNCMNVYRVDAFAKPPSSKFDFYPHLESKKADEAFLDRENFQGKPYPKKWRRLELFFDEPLRPRADFYAKTHSHFFCNARAKVILDSTKAGELLPVTIEGEKETHYLFNVTVCGSYVDHANSVVEFYPKKNEPIKPPFMLVAPAFFSEALESLSVFKIPEQCKSTIYCVDAFKEMVESNDLRGLRFRLAWSKDRGPVPDRHPPTTRGIGWMLGDGKKFRPR